MSEPQDEQNQQVEFIEAAALFINKEENPVARLVLQYGLEWLVHGGSGDFANPALAKMGADILRDHYGMKTTRQTIKNEGEVQPVVNVTLTNNSAEALKKNAENRVEDYLGE